MGTRVGRFAAALVIAGCPCAFAWAGGAGQGLGPEWVAVDPQRLDGMRGGFELPSGLSVSFGIERLVRVNGELVASVRVSIADVGRMTPVEAQALADLQRGTVVQIGAGNAFTPAGGLDGVVIQNVLDGQAVHSLTTLDVGVGTLGMFQELNAQAALQFALQRAPGTP